MLTKRCWRITQGLLLLLGMQFGSAVAVAENIVVVVNPATKVFTVSRSELINIYMGRQKRFDNGHPAFPLDLSDTKYRSTFYKQLVGKDLMEIKAYWARVIFSGQGFPPTQLQQYRDVIEMVSNNSAAIGYLPASKVPKNLRPVFKIEVGE